MKKEDVIFNTAIIRIASENGFDFSGSNFFDDIAGDAIQFIEDNEPNGHDFVQCDFSSGKVQSYFFVDECGHTIETWGEIFDFGHHYSKDDERLFYKDGNTFTPVAWYDVPEGKEREKYVFIYARHAMSDGKVAWLYDHLKA